MDMVSPVGSKDLSDVSSPFRKICKHFLKLSRESVDVILKCDLPVIDTSVEASDNAF